MDRKKRAGAKLVPSVSEAQIQAMSVQLLQRYRIFCHSVPNEGSGKDMLRTQRLISMGLRKGVADLVVWWPDGIGYLEMKTPKGRLSPAQRQFARMCGERGISYDMARSIDDVVAIMHRHGIKEAR